MNIVAYYIAERQLTDIQCLNQKAAFLGRQVRYHPYVVDLCLRLRYKTMMSSILPVDY